MDNKKIKKTVISFDDSSLAMLIQTTDYNMMYIFDKCVEESCNWKLVEVGRAKGEIVSKTYEAPKNFLILKAADENKDSGSLAEIEEGFVPELDRFQELAL